MNQIREPVSLQFTKFIKNAELFDRLSTFIMYNLKS